jgi:hypothetical protein
VDCEVVKKGRMGGYEVGGTVVRDSVIVRLNCDNGLNKLG